MFEVTDGWSEAANRRQTDTTMAKMETRIKWQERLGYTKEVIRIHQSKNTDNTMAKMETRIKWQERLGYTKEVIRIHQSKNTDNTMAKMKTKWTKGQEMIGDTIEVNKIYK